MSRLLPCQESFKLHCSRTCFIAALWRRSITNQIDAPSPIGRGWDGDISIEWIRKAFPDEVELLLVECQEELEDFEDVDQGSDFKYESEYGSETE